MPRNSKLPLLAALGLAICLFGLTTSASAEPSGKDLYGKCIQCHGEQGHGNQMFLAPAIAGLPAWYIVTQVTNFKSDVRGYHYDDIAGHRMRPMARMLRSEAEIKAVADYVSKLKPVKPKQTLKGGDPEAGKTAYATCTACHGTDGKGNEALGAPDIRYTGDWYLLAQLKKFKAGHRGVNPKDVKGMSMRPMAMNLADEQAMKDVIAYIMTLVK